MENADAVTFGDARSVILHNKLDHIVVLHDGHKDAAPAIFGGVLDQIAQHFIQVLPFHANYGCLVSVNVQSHIRIEPAYRPLHSDQARPDFGPAMRRPSPTHRARAGEVMVNLTSEERRGGEVVGSTVQYRG